jgi:tRNA (guanine-N7-)-methyltransferase
MSRAAVNRVPSPPSRHTYAARGRLTRGQRRALEHLWPRYGIDAAVDPLCLDAVFGRRAPRHLEIGFGMGDALTAMAGEHPDIDYLGLEIYAPGIGSVLRKIEAGQLGNVRVLWGDAAALLQNAIPAAALEAIYILFPDPWPKKRHHKRRLIQPEFANILAARLSPGGRVHVATDWEDYAQHILRVLESTPDLRNAAGTGRFADGTAVRPLTKFERRGRRLGHGVWDLVFTRA